MEEIEPAFDEETDDGRRFRTFIDHETGDEMREYEASGVIYNVTKARIKRGAITKENAAELQAMGAEAKRNKPVEAARAGLLRGVSATQLVEDYEMAWEHVVAAQAELAMAVDMGNASTRAAEFIARMADLDPSRHRESIRLGDGTRTISLEDMSAERLDYILGRLTGR